MIDLTELRALEAEATPGPWRAHHCISQSTISAPALAVDFVTVNTDGGDDDAAQGDAALIVAMRNALPGLLDRLEKAEAKLDAVDLAVLQARESGDYETRLWRLVTTIERMP